MAYLQQPANHLRFLMTVTSLSGNPYFGLCALDENGRCLGFVHSLSPSRPAVSRLAGSCNLWQPDPVHLPDLAEDFLP